MKIKKLIKQLFCKHEYDVKPIKGGFLFVDGWSELPYEIVCRKCGKRKEDESNRSNQKSR